MIIQLLFHKLQWFLGRKNLASLSTDDVKSSRHLKRLQNFLILQGDFLAGIFLATLFLTDHA